MEMVILVVHVIVALAIIGVILLQPPENSAMGGLGGANPMAGLAGRGQGNILTRATAILVTIFIITSLTLAILAGRNEKAGSILDLAEPDAAAAGAEAPAVPSPVSEKPAIPLAE